MRGVNDLINASSFAVIGASRDEKKVGHVIFKNLISSNRHVYPINPKAEKILGHKCYKNLEEIQQEIDCVIIATPTLTVKELFKEAIKKGASSIIIASSGFAEIGNKELEKEICEIADRNNVILLGPNSFGFINPLKNTNTTFFQGNIERGNIAFISQSGAIASAVLDRKEKLSGFVSVGNSAQRDFSDFIEYYSKDKNTKVICLYMESLKENRGKRFLEVCKKSEKPIVVLKAGKSEKGKKAASTHTGALASEKEVYSGILKQAGAIEVESIKEMFQVARILEKYSYLKNKACIVTNAGGPGVLTSDYCEENNINLLTLPKETLEKLNHFLPINWSKNNPIDILGDADARQYYKTLKILDEESFFDFFIVLLTPQNMTQPLETAKILTELRKPVFACFLGKEKIDEAKKFLERNEIPFFDEPKEMCEGLGRIFNK
jgi:acetyltransferase